MKGDNKNRDQMLENMEKGEKMKKNARILVVVFLVLSSIILATCSAQSDTPPTLTFTVEGCAFSGPKSISPDFTLTRIGKVDSQDSFAYVMGTLESGKTIDDVAGWKSSEPPSWFTIVHLDKIVKGNATSTVDINLSANAAYKNAPLYIFCFLNDIKYSQVGPIKVKK
jgi:hypothetical protein